MSGIRTALIIAIFVSSPWMVSAQEGTLPLPEGTLPPEGTFTSPNATLAPSEVFQPSQTTSYEDRLIHRLKSEIMKELEEGDLLSRKISLAIQDYVKKQVDNQQAAQQAARDEADRLALERARQIRHVSGTRDHVYGNPSAPFSIIEYSDYECAYCKRFHPTVKELIEAFDGEINWVYRHFPLAFHNPAAQKKAEAAECAGELGGNEVFWKFSDVLYERGQTGGKGFDIAQLTPFAVEVGLDKQAFEDCLSSGKFKMRVEEDFDEGTRIGITGTPGNILLNNKTGAVEVVHGAQPLSTLKARVEKLLGRNAVKVPGVLIQEGGSFFINGELGKYQITGPLLQALKNTIGKSVVIHGFLTSKDQIEATWFSEKRKNTLELYVMSMCPFSINAEAAILDFLDSVPEASRPILDVRYVFYEKNSNGKKTLTGLHGEKEVQENLVQMVIRDTHPTIFQNYLLMRIDQPDAAWQKLVMELGMAATGIQAVVQSITSQREVLIQKEYKYVAGVHQIFSTPSYVWESEKVADIGRIEPFKNLAFSTTENCSN